MSVKLDPYGWPIDETKEITEAEQELLAKESAKQTERESKWIRMLGEWNTLDRSLLHSRIKKGIPNAVRGRVWYLLLCPGEESRVNLDSIINKGAINDERTIEADITRTIPGNVSFTCNMLESLKRVLLAYSAENPQIGYTQGMSFIAGYLLLYMEEGQCYQCFTAIMNEKYGYREMFREGFPRLHDINKVWMKAFEDKYPKAYERIIELQIDPLLYTPGWFLCGFTQCEFHPELRMRIFERFIAFGTRAYLSFALVVISRLKHRLEKANFEEALEMLQRVDKCPEFADWRYVAKKMDHCWLREYEYKKYFRKAGLGEVYP